MADTVVPVGPSLLTAAAATVYTVPAATTAVVVKIHVFNTDTVDRSVTISRNADAAGTRIYDAFVISSRQFLDDTGPYALAAGDTIQAYGSVATKLLFVMAVVETA